MFFFAEIRVITPHALKRLKRFPSKIIAILFAALLPICFYPTDGIAADGDRSGRSIRFEEQEKRDQYRRATRKSMQEREQQAERSERRESLRSSSRLDYKLDRATVKVTDGKVIDQKYLAAEMEREREERKIDEEEIHRFERRRARAVRTERRAREIEDFDIRDRKIEFFLNFD